MGKKPENITIEELKETTSLGYLRLDPGRLLRKNWQGYMYIDFCNEDYVADPLFHLHNLGVVWNKQGMATPDGKWEFVFCKVLKKDVEMFEACLYQVHTILSKEEGYEDAIQLLEKSLEM